jgi:UDP-N-acetyl-D-mannosaminuronic acid dehydrogenase
MNTRRTNVVAESASTASPSVQYDLAIVGGAGHIGLPMALVMADSGLNVHIVDLDVNAITTIKRGQMPFTEQGAQPILERMLSAGRLSFSAEATGLANAAAVILTIGTPVDEFLNPEMKAIKRWADDALPYLVDDQLIILRSTLYPGTTEWLDGYLKSRGKNVRLAYCPERIVQGFAIEELQKLPQIVSGTTPEAADAAAKLFLRIAKDVVYLSTAEAEFAKLFANAYRYIQFATANQFYMIANAAGVDYNRVLDGLKQNYPRAAGIPRAGLAAGPCLLKDTMQLAAFSRNHFALGHAAMLANEGLILYMIDELKKNYPLESMTVGILGMAFKAECDDIRSSLSYKLKKFLKLHAREVVTTDPYVTVDPELVSTEAAIERSDLLVLCAPHKVYQNLDLRGKPLYDIWGFVNPEARGAK